MYKLNQNEEPEAGGKIFKNKRYRITFTYTATIILLCVLFLAAVNTGSLKISYKELFYGLFIKYNPDVSVVFDLRFPRIIISMLAGAAVAVSGVLFQAVLKNPLADPGIIGVSSGAGLAAVCVTALFPSAYFFTPVIACAGGILAFLIVYALSWSGGLDPLHIILAGIATDAFFTGVQSIINSMSGGSRNGVASIVEGNITQKTWQDVQALVPFVVAGLFLAMLFVKKCNILALEDKTARSLGINVSRARAGISVIAVILASISTAVAGTVSFLGLIVPHIGRLLVGSDHKKLVPFSALAGAFTFLLADTAGRTIARPYEVAAPVIMSVIGGPFFIVLLKRKQKTLRK